VSLLRKREHLRLVVGGTILGATIGLLIAVLLPRPYIATATIMPEATSRTGLGGLSGLGGALGLSSEALLGRESIKFYADLLRSRELLEQVAAERYRLPDGREVTLVDAWGGSSGDSVSRLLQARRRLTNRTAVSADPSTGLIKFAVRATERGVATQVMQAYVDALKDFNQRRRNSRARAEREFLGRRLAEVSSQLDSVEQALEQFYLANRRIEGSPRLVFEETRLRRRVELVQNLYVEVARSHDEARLNEVRDTPIITEIDRPDGSEERVPSRIGLLLIVGGLIGAAAAVIWRRGGVVP